ncbi:PI-PLC X domain-containing protein 1-like [Arctopsyche grandis]|uniref:PI-PLC X domain-containing protein 1-like n=1 Tax=Arctopsyche grandis TaxID=121162 RepID=UPI00406D7DF4
MASTSRLPLLLLLILWTIFFKVDSSLLPSPSDCGAIHLTVSALDYKLSRNPSKDNFIELNWDLSRCSGVPDSQIPNQIALYKNDPTTSNASIPLTTIFLKDHEWGYYVTDTTLGEIRLPGKRAIKYINNKIQSNIRASNSICLPFWIASFRDNQLLKSDCLKMQPTWMGDIKQDIADLQLFKIILPGTHNAGSYQFQTMLQLFRSNLIERFTLCQGVDIYTQLIFGIRYLDFRISYQALSSEKLWLSHGMVRVRPLMPLLQDIKRFLRLTSDEIVILDVHQLPAGFYDSNDAILEKRHDTLIEVFLKEFSEYIVDYEALMNSVGGTQTLKVQDIWNSGKKLIIGYPERRIISKYKWLWPAVTHMWANTNNPYELKTYLDRVMYENNMNSLWSAMAQTTPTPMDIVFSDKSLKLNADAINRNLTKWVQYDWSNRANIVSSDFFLGNNVINLAVYYNSLKGQMKKTTLGKMMFPY